MARPKKNAEGKNAQERLEEAFWDSLAEAPYAEMTIMGISKRASVNHNTFYRYYDNLNDMARKLLNGLIVEELPGFLLSTPTSEARFEETVSAQVNLDDFHKALLFARSGSAYLTSILHDAIADVWLNAAAVDKEKLTAEQRFDIDIIFGGLVAAIGNMKEIPDRSLLAENMARPLRKGMIATLTSLAKKSELDK